MTPIDTDEPGRRSEFACIDLINSAFTHHLGRGLAQDRLSSDQWRAWFVTRHGLEVDEACPAPVKKLATLRDELRAILERWARDDSLESQDAEVLSAWVSAVPMRQRVTKELGTLGMTLDPVRRDWAWVMAMVAASAVELISTSPSRRLKVCANPDCSWMFYDHTPNYSKEFCSPSPCGSLMRVRRFRGRGGVQWV